MHEGRNWVGRFNRFHPDCRAWGQEPCESSCVLSPMWNTLPESHLKAFFSHIQAAEPFSVKQWSFFVLTFRNLPAPSCEHRPSYFGLVFMTSFVTSFKVLVLLEALWYPFHYHELQVDPGCPKCGRQTSQMLFRSLLFQLITRAGKIT